MAIASVQESVNLGAALWHPNPEISVLICWPSRHLEGGTPATSSVESQSIQIQKQYDSAPVPAKQMTRPVSRPQANHTPPVAVLTGPEPTLGDTCTVSNSHQD
jgi:hypothetical protein